MFRVTARVGLWLSAILGLWMMFGAGRITAAEYEIFDGRLYNGRYYPRIDIIEAGTPSHMEFQVYWKGHAVELAFSFEEVGNKKRMLVNYFIKERNARLCRFVPTPGHFSNKFFVYQDNSDPDMDNTIVSMQELEPKAGRTKVEPQKKYAPCVESEAETTPNTSAPSSSEAKPSSQSKPRGGPGALHKPTVDVPFGDL